MKVQDVIDGMKKNGLPHLQGSYASFDENGKVVAACVWGQAGKNCGIDPADLQSAVSTVTREMTQKRTTSKIVRMNDFATPDSLHLHDNFVPIEYEKVVEYAEEVLSPFADEELDLSNAATWDEFVERLSEF